jgi:hypothetical protein
MRRLLVLFPLLGLLSACSIVQEVKPVAMTSLPVREICVVENPDVREGFLEAYRQALEGKGLTVKLLKAGAGVTQCPLTSTYTANWRWDLVMYMAFAEMTIYQDGRPVGKALYDSLMGGGRIDKKFINAEEKIRELVNQLFPG